MPLFNLFKEEFKPLLSKDIKEYKELNQIIETIEQKEKDLDKINKKIFGGKLSFFEIKKDKDIK